MNVLKNLFKGDKVIWTVYFLLCLISIIEVYSASSSMTFKTGSYWSPVLSHTAFLVVGTVIVIVIHNIPCRYFKIIPVVFLPLSFLLLGLVLLRRGDAVNDAARWLPIFGMKFQPSELAKGTMVITTALILGTTQTEHGADKVAFRYIIGLTILVCGLILPENFSTAGILFVVVLLMMFIGRVSLVQLGKLLGVLAILAVAVLLALRSMPMNDVKGSGSKIPGMHRLSTWVSRVQDHTDKTEITPSQYKIGDNLQRAHGNIAIASSNILGKGPGNSEERDFLPQAYSDFIYAIIIEELGLLGGALVVFLYVVLLVRAGRIASHCERNFPAFLVMGLSLLISLQAMINMMVAVGILPVTGQPLPLISRGGTSVFVNCAYIGMILSVSRYAKKKKELKDGKEPLEEDPDATDEYYNEENME
jgi:cell division protein FtsW